MSLQNELGDDYQVFIGMRHWKPWIMEAMEKMRQNNITKAIGIVMAPHYSSMSIEKYIEKVEEAKNQLKYPLEVNFIKSWHDHPLFIEALHKKIEKALDKFSDEEKKNIHVIFTAHSLPEKILENGDPYKDQLLETCELLAKKDHFKHWTFAFQSAGRTQDKWLGPDLLHVIDDLHGKGVKAILVCSVGFITDHLEVLYDIDIEGKNHAKNLGIHLERTESLNADILLAKLLAKLTKEKLK
jgi:protoporphyrin/coproporphyrin ferrochelatase